jgi:uncharacterized ferredoxin-like protein
LDICVYNVPRVTSRIAQAYRTAPSARGVDTKMIMVLPLALLVILGSTKEWKAR